MLTALGLLTASLLLGAPVPAAEADPLPSPPPLKDSSSDIVSADALPTVQLDNGVVWSQVMIGNIVYVGGNFSNTRPPGAAQGTNLTPRSNVLAYDITTGDLVPGFAPQVNGQVRTITKSPDGSRLYIGGDFTKVNGVNKYLVAALNPSTGALLSTFTAAVGGSFVSSIVATNSTVYLGGLFTAANGSARANLAAYSSSGALLNWTPSTDLQVDAMVLAPGGSKIIVGGRFGKVNGTDQRGLAALDSSTGTTLPWAAPDTIKNGSSTGPNAGKAGIYSLSTDGTSVFGTGWGFADVNTGNLEGAFSAKPDSGEINWVEACHGDTYGVFSDSATVYTLSHAHYCGTVGGFPQSEPDWGVNMRHAIAFTAEPTGTLSHDPYAGGTYKDWYGTPGPSMINWFPDFYTGKFTGVGQAAWSVTGNGNYLSLGGEFPGVNGSAQYGLVRFAKRTVTTPKQGPRLTGSNWPISVNTAAPGIARVTFGANWDRDNMKLTYKLIRDNDTAHPVAQKSVSSTFWDRPTVGLTDSSATPGSHSYKVIVSDPDGNTVTSSSVTASVVAGSISPYGAKVLDDDASLYWRLGEDSGSSAQDLSGSNDGIVRSGVSFGQPGAITDDPDTAASFNGSSSGYVAATSAGSARDTFTATAWFKTTTGRGGKIFGFGNSNDGSSSNYDRHVYMDNAGHVIFGVYPGSTQTVQSTDTYNDGDWHQAVASLGSGGMRLIIDGEQIAARTDVTSAQAYTGYWRIGGDNLGGWPSGPSSSNFAGSIDEFAVFDSVLSADDARALYTLGTGGQPNQSPTAAFTSNTDELKLTVDAADSSDSDGTVASYAWDWGDGSADGSGKTATHTYGSAGDYTVKLTVTDNDGATDTVSHSVTVAANQKPTAAFTASTDGLAVSVDAAGSADPDGTVASYAWDWGDASADGSGKTATHTYASAGDYTVKLTVTDNDGATDAVTKTITVQQPQAGVIAADQFSRNQTGGWGSADTGGAWSLTGSTGAYAVSGGTGNISMTQIRQSNVAQLSGVSTRDVAMLADVSMDKTPNGGGGYAYLTARKTASGEELLKLQFTASGSVVMSLSRLSAGAETILTSATVPGVAASDTLRVRFQVDGTAPATLSAKVWKASGTEPSSWLRTVTDNSASAQLAGSVGVRTYLSGTTTNLPVTASFDNLRVTSPSTGEANQDPTAAFTTAIDHLVVSVDGTTSADPDGTITGYSWDWGDGTPDGAGATGSHRYTAAGDYVVKLTVTDNGGATASTTHTVTVAAADDALASDDFSRTTSSGWGSATTGGAWTVSGTASQYAVADGVGKITISQARQSNVAQLAAVSSRDLVLTSDVKLDRTPNGNGAYVYFSARKTASAEEMLKLQFAASGSVIAQLSRLANGTETILATATVPNVTATDALRIRLQAVGDGTTTSLSGKVWASTAAEPSTWLVTANDATASVQGAGGVAIRSYASGTTTTFPVTVAVDNLRVLSAAAGA
ncbi:PKD domain-containing protein [Microlunatus soli]|uniref:PKD domain-containing protein n=1 Tax=Microlunatus soli TaxID=630515 RepID=UPI001E64644E|nr:PKD domain-containing protein [Microlunatus soli]